ncbi:hypothetical protein ANOBCDAF_04406 [Pleomorphomonas sp. T1.2MG-36]|uniref:hypothetical protein n=1 Tax=Pleomorphomonas sp. T1.2MG-36 TaxID=3041167 RepID=UPI00247748D2|nr:hypothetical protein [Pleomorphomonas sp. T1.2MG-36]CAI9418890.1 hypothetical protein ANOBCDAF_04406 [Pleomorphomonas sp. T1.2MG-36]
MSFPKSGNMLPSQRHGKPRKPSFARLVSTALRASLKGQSSKVKTVALWTGANERTVKNWLSGERAPSGDHFLGLAANCPAVLAAFLAAIQRNDCLVMADIEEARAKVAAALMALEAVRAAQLGTAAALSRDDG